ncbi:hypothetical protein B0H19DRAFT_1235997 [Mycena capillaripes]|nr:hypothetical protein B0H19DRAFT_1235997 [Mycena capillaripes]
MLPTIWEIVPPAIHDVGLRIISTTSRNILRLSDPARAALIRDPHRNRNYGLRLRVLRSPYPSRKALGQTIYGDGSFKTPRRFRRDHVSHMRLDRLRRICQPTGSPSGVASKALADSASDLIPVFVDISAVRTITLAVTPTMTVRDIRKAVCHRAPRYIQGHIYLMGLWRPLCASETMSELGIRGLRHFIMPLRVLGEARGRDRISRHHSRLKPETIRMLMLLKHHLHLKRKVLADALLATEEL